MRTICVIVIYHRLNERHLFRLAKYRKISKRYTWAMRSKMRVDNKSSKCYRYHNNSFFFLDGFEMIRQFRWIPLFTIEKYNARRQRISAFIEIIHKQNCTDVHRIFSAPLRYIALFTFVHYITTYSALISIHENRSTYENSDYRNEWFKRRIVLENSTGNRVVLFIKEFKKIYIYICINWHVKYICMNLHTPIIYILFAYIGLGL